MLPAATLQARLAALPSTSRMAQAGKQLYVRTIFSLHILVVERLYTHWVKTVYYGRVHCPALSAHYYFICPTEYD